MVFWPSSVTVKVAWHAFELLCTRRAQNRLKKSLYSNWKFIYLWFAYFSCFFSMISTSIWFYLYSSDCMILELCLFLFTISNALKSEMSASCECEIKIWIKPCQVFSFSAGKLSGSCQWSLHISDRVSRDGGRCHWLGRFWGWCITE